MFAGSTISDAINYNRMLNLAPFYVFVLANADASYNGGDFDLAFYRNYMTKNTIRFSRGTLYKDGLDDYAVRAVVLAPANYPVKNFARLNQKDFVFDDRVFWRM